MSSSSVYRGGSLCRFLRPFSGEEVGWSAVREVARLYARRVGLSEEDAEDCASAFVAKMLLAAPDDASSLPWVHRCAKNHAVDFARACRRRQGRELAFDIFTDTPSPEGRIAHETIYALEAALNRLSAGEREAIVRHHLRGEAVASIATSTRQSVGAVEQVLHRGRARLRLWLNHEA